MPTAIRIYPRPIPSNTHTISAVEFNPQIFPIVDRLVGLYECAVAAPEKAYTLEQIIEALDKLEDDDLNVKAFCDVIDQQHAAMVLRCLSKKAKTGPVGYCVQQRLRSLILAVSRLKTV